MTEGTGLRFEALNRLWESVRRSSHDFHPTTQIFPDLDVERVAIDLDLEKKGAERGSANEPAANAASFDENELEIIERIEREKKTALQSIEDEMRTFGERITSLDFDGQFVMIKQVNATTVTDYVAEVELGIDELHGPRRALAEAEHERATFKDTHKIDRAPRTQSTAISVLKIMFLVVCVMLETVFNGSFLAAGSEEGIVGGATVAAGFSFLNIGVAALAAFLVKNFRHRSIFRKFIGIVTFPLYLGFAGLLNLALGHYRETSQVLFGGAGREVIRRLTESPFQLSDIQSWILTGVGIAFSIGAFIDASTFGDPYLGYAGVERRLQKRRDTYVDARQELIDQLRNVRDDYSSKIEDIVRDLGARKLEYDAIILHQTRLLHLFEEHQDQLERAANLLLTKYRSANRSARITPPPVHFADSYKLKRSPSLQQPIGERDGAELSTSIRNAQDELIEQARRIADHFESAVAKYLNLDALHPDRVNGPPQT